MVAAVVVEGVVGIAAGTHGLGFQRLQRPTIAHLIGHNSNEVVLHVHDVHHGEISPVYPLITETAGVAVTLEPSAGLPCSSDVGHDAKGRGGAAVKLEQDLRLAGLGHVDGIGAGAHHGAAQTAGPAFGLRLGLIGAHTNLIRSVDPGHKAVGVVRRFGIGGIVAVIGSRHLYMVAANQLSPVVRGGVAGAADPDILSLDHGQLGNAGAGAAQLHKVQIAVVISTTVPGAVAGVILQVGADQGATAVGQPHPQGEFIVPGGPGRGRHRHRHGHSQNHCGKLHKYSFHGKPHFSNSSHALP